MSDEEEEGYNEPTAPAWMATFGDLMSLLLTFFVLLLSFASMDAKRFAEVSGSVRDAFGVQRKHPGKVEALATSLIQFSDEESTPSIPTLKVPAVPSAAEQELLARLRLTISGQNLDRLVKAESTPRGVVVRVPGSMLFDPGSTDLRPESLVFLREVADLVHQMPGEVAIEGHTDDTPGGAGDNASNWHISSLRAISALRYLTDVGGIDASRLRATGFAATRPLTGNATTSDREKNRRVEFVFLRPNQDAAPSELTAAAAGPGEDGEETSPSAVPNESSAVQPGASPASPEGSESGGDAPR